MGRRIKIHLLFWFAGLCWHQLVAQNMVSPGQLLTGNKIESRALVADTYFADLLSTRARWPWVDKFEFRTETDRLMTNRQEFLFRTSFLGFSRKKFEFLRHRALAETKIADYRQERYDMYYERCLFVVDMIKNRAEADMAATRVQYHSELDSLYLIQLAAGGEPDLRDFLKNREDWLETEKIAAERVLYQKIMLEKEGYDSFSILDIVDVISPDSIIKIIHALSVDENTHPELAELQSERRLLDAELGAEKAKDRKILDFAQVRYTTREDLLFENRFSVGVGINIPWSGGSRLRHEEIHVKQQENTFEKVNQFENLYKRLQDKKAEADILYRTYLLYLQRNNNKDWQTTRKIIEESGRVNPADLFRLRLYELDRMEKISDIYHDLLRVYIEALYHAGKLDTRDRIFEE